MKRYSSIFFIVVLLVLTAPMATKAFAAGEEGNTPQVALSVFQASPGATIEVSGGRFEPDIGVTFRLVQNGTEIQLGSALCDDHGEFTVPLLLPLELQVGQYEFRAVDEKNRIAIAPLTLVAAENNMEVPREDADALLAPMPTYVPGVSATAMPQAASTAESAPAHTALTPFVWLASGVGVLLLFGLILISRRK